MCLHPSTNKWQLIMYLHSLVNKRQLTSFRSLKIHHELAFWRVLPQYQSWSLVCFSADAYVAKSEWGSPMPISPGNKERVGERDGPFHYSVCYYSPLLTARESQLPIPQPVWGVIFPRHSCDCLKYPIYQPLRSGRIWHKVNFLAEFNRFEFRAFLLLDKSPHQGWRI